MPPKKRPRNASNDYFANLERRLRRIVNAESNSYVLNRNKGPFDKVEIKWSAPMRRLILKNVQTREDQRRRGHLKRLVALLDDLAREKELHAVEIQSIQSPHVMRMLPWRNFPPPREFGMSSTKRYRAPEPLWW